MAVKLGKQAILIIMVMIIVATLLFVVLPTSDTPAYASNAEIPLIGYADGVKDTEYNALDGVKLAITCSTKIYKLTYVFQFTNNRDDLEGELKYKANPDDKDEVIAIYHAYDNGDLTVTSWVLEVDGETITEYESTTFVVDNIDSQAPKIDDSQSSSTVNGNTIDFSRTVTDRISITPDNSYSAYSGLAYIAVFYFHADCDYDKIDFDSMDYDSLKEAEDIVTFLVDFKVIGAHTSVPVNFTASEDGLYCMYALDYVGNSSFTIMFPLVLEPVYTVTVGGTTIDCGELIKTAEKQYEAGEKTYSPALLAELKTATDNLSLAFMNEKSDEEKYAMWKALREAQIEYNTAGRQEIYKAPKITNGEFLSGELSFKNMNKESVPALIGEVVQPEIIVAKFSNLGDIDAEIVNKSGINNANLVIRLSYSLTKDGKLQVPKEDIALYMELPKSYENVAVICDAQDGYTRVSKLTFGTQWLQFDVPFATMDYYLVIHDASSSSFLSSMSTVQVIAFWGGIVAVVAIIAVVIIVVAKKKTVKVVVEEYKGATAEGEEPTEQQEEKTEQAKHSPKNKSKKKK